MILKMFCLGSLLTLSACGYGLRGGIGPSWIVDEGPGAAAQVGAPLLFVGFQGLNYSLVPSLWGRVSTESAVAGVGIGLDFGYATTASTTEKEDSPRRGFGGSASGHARYGTGGPEAVVGVNIKHSTARVCDRHKILLSRSEKGGSTYLRWYDWIYRSRGVTAQAGIDVVGERIRNIDVLWMAEWMTF